MKNSIIKIVLLVNFAIYTLGAHANGSAQNVIKVINPIHSNGIQIGDVLNRTIEFETDAIYQLTKTSLPMKGESRDGVEVREVTTQSTKHGEKVIYKVEVSYQVFASSAMPVIMRLPREYIELTGGSKNIAIDVPAWPFWFSPLVTEDITNAKDNLQPQQKPALINLKPYQVSLWFSVGSLMLGLVGLIYVNADKGLLPFMNGAFAQAYRHIKRLPNHPSSHLLALMQLHRAFNIVNGANLFESEIEQFLLKNPKFSKMANEIKDFFNRSNIALFSNHQSLDTQLKSDILLLSKQLRDCERGV